MKMKNLKRFDQALKEQMNNAQFKKLYEDECRKYNIGSKVAQLRRKLKWTQKELALRMGTTQSAISRIENGDYWSFKISTLGKIALVTGADLRIQFKL